MMKRTGQMMSESNPRQMWKDIARGVGIFFVVYGHVLRGLASAHIIGKESFFYCSDYSIYTFHMPLFFLLAGLNVEHSLQKGKKNFLLGKLWLIAYPYFLWSLFQGSVQIALARYINAPPSWHDLAQIAWKPIGQFWFLLALFIVHLLAMLTASKLRFLAPLAVVSYGYCAIYANSITGSAANMLLFYVLGIFLGRHEEKLYFGTPRLAFIGTLSALAYTLCVWWGRHASAGNYYGIASLPACLMGIFFVLLASQLCERMAGVFSRILAQVGLASMTIYVMHILACSGARVVLGKLAIRDPVPHLLLGTACGILIPYMAHQFLQKFNLLYLLGLAPIPFSANRKRSSQLASVQRA